VELALQVEKIRAIWRNFGVAGRPACGDARTDIYLMPIGEAAARFERTVERPARLSPGWAACLFAREFGTGKQSPNGKGAFWRASEHSADTWLPFAGRARKAGRGAGKRGFGVMRATLGLVRRIGKELMEKGTFESVVQRRDSLR